MRKGGGVGGRSLIVCGARMSADTRHNRGGGYRLGHAWSDELANGTREDMHPLLDVTPGGWDSDMLCYPHVFECDGQVYLLYNGNEFGCYGFGVAVLE